MPGRGLVVHLGELEAVSMQMNGVSVIGLVIENQPVALALLQRCRRRLFIKALLVDGPAVEPAFAAIDLSEHERNGLDRARAFPLPPKFV